MPRSRDHRERPVHDVVVVQVLQAVDQVREVALHVRAIETDRWDSGRERARERQRERERGRERERERERER